jgi:DNA-binding transcriptional MerR regulator
MPFTVTQLARACRLSRTAILYYESAGLLKPPARTAANYRVYSTADLDRLRRICAYRDSGLTIADIRTILDSRAGNPAAVLRRRLSAIGDAIQRMRQHQQAIARLLTTTDKLRNKHMTKEKWTGIMHKAGFSQDDMRRWHAEFENSAPEDHQEFLEYLHIPADEIKTIRQWSRVGESHGIGPGARHGGGNSQRRFSQ